MSYSKADFIRHLNEFNIDTFSRTADDYLFTRNFSDGFQEIAISTSVFFPNSFIFDGIVAGIRFHSVEKIIEDVCSKNIQNYPINGKTILYVYNFNNPKTTINTRRISGDESFYVARQEIYNIVKSHILPFFDKYNNLEQVLVETNKMEMSELANFINQPLPLRRMIIKKLANDHDYDEYAQSIIEYFKNDKSFNIDYYPIVVDLYEMLKQF